VGGEEGVGKGEGVEYGKEGVGDGKDVGVEVGKLVGTEVGAKIGVGEGEGKKGEERRREGRRRKRAKGAVIGGWGVGAEQKLEAQQKANTLPGPRPSAQQSNERQKEAVERCRRTRGGTLPQANHMPQALLCHSFILLVTFFQFNVICPHENKLKTSYFP
jgi:hypothetical protein